MQHFLKDRLKQKLPKAKFSEEYLKNIRVINMSTENWIFQCNHCNKMFRGRAYCANCHIIGKVGEGVKICRDISSEAKTAFIAKVFPELIEDYDVKPSEPKKLKQSSISSFVSQPNFKVAAAELAKFCYTSGVSFNALRNPHLQKACNALASGFQVPSKYIIEGPMLKSEDESITTWKTGMLLKGYVAVTGDGMTNRRRVGCINVEALTRYGPVHVDTHERKAETEAVDADYVAKIFNTSITELGGAARVVNIVSDNETKMRNVWELVKQAHPGVLSLPCSAHIGNLLMKDIGNIPRVHRLLVAVCGICDHVLNHSFPLTLFL